jgi:hypothetical protein
MKLLITFGQPRKVSENKPRHLTLRFPFTVRRIGNGALPEAPSHHYVDVEISNMRMVEWGFGSGSHVLNNRSLIKTLFAFALDEVTPELRSGDLRESYSKVLHSCNSPEKNPYDPTTIPEPEGFSFEIQQ